MGKNMTTGRALVRILLLVLLALGNVTFLVTDFLLTTLDKRYFHRKKA